MIRVPIFILAPLMVLSIVGCLALYGCGHADTYAPVVTNSDKSWWLVKQWCATDTSPLCTPGNMRAMADSSLCPEASALYNNGQPIPPGIPCKPPGAK